jgi:hypothetical protein
VKYEVLDSIHNIEILYIHVKLFGARQHKLTNLFPLHGKF